MKRIVLAVVAVMFMCSTVYALGLQEMIAKQMTPENRAAYLEQTNTARQKHVEAINSNKKGYADQQVKNIDNQIAFYQKSIDDLKARKEQIAKNPTDFANAQIAIVEKQIQADATIVKNIKSTVATPPVEAGKTAVTTVTTKPAVKPAH